MSDEQPYLSEFSRALPATTREVEEFVAAAGWDQQPQLFALVPTPTLLARQPDLASQLDTEAALTPVAQESLPEGNSTTRWAVSNGPRPLPAARWPRRSWCSPRRPRPGSASYLTTRSRPAASLPIIRSGGRAGWSPLCCGRASGLACCDCGVRRWRR